MQREEYQIGFFIHLLLCFLFKQRFAQVAIPLTIGSFVGQSLAVGMEVVIEPSETKVESAFCIGAARMKGAWKSLKVLVQT